jgi:hypothetical protein
MKHTIEYYNDRCAKLLDYGFEVNHMDSNVSMYTQGYNEINFDFSGVPEELWFKHVLNTAYFKGREDGKKEAQEEIKKVLGIK